MNKWSKKVKEKLQEKNGEHKNLRAALFELAKDDGYIMKPIRLINIFHDWLKEHQSSTMNAQQARIMAEVYCTLNHMYYIAAEKYKIKKAFSVSQSIWKKLCIKQAALKNSISLLKEMGLIDYKNYCKNGDPTERKRYYLLNLKMLEFRISEFKNKHKTPEPNFADELDFKEWKNYKGRKKKIPPTLPISDKALNPEQDEPQPTDYDDINDLLDDGWYFC